MSYSITLETQNRNSRSRVRARVKASMLFAAFVFAVVIAPARTFGQESEWLSRLVQTSGNSDAAMQAFRQGRDLITEEKWPVAAARFNSFIDQFPSDKNVDAAFFWLAYAQRKQNKYREADDTLARLINEHPRSTWARDARKLRVEIAPFIDPQVAERAARDADVEIKVIALQSLCQADPQRCVSLVGDVLRGGTQSPLRLKEAAITLLGRYGGKDAIPALTGIARNDTDEKLRVKAIAALGATDDESVLELLKELGMRTDFSDYGVTDSALHALVEHDSPRAVRMLGDIALGGKNLEARKHAVSLLARRKGEEAVDELFRIYDGDQNIEIRKQALASLGNRRSQRAIDRLTEIARGAGDVELRKQAIRAIPNRNSEQDLDVLLPLYDSERDEELKDTILNGIGQYQNRRAYQKLMEVARSNAPVERRKRAIMFLSRSKDPEVLKFLEGILK